MTRLFRNILVPHDFSPHATRALRVAADLAAAQKGSLLVLHAIPPIHPVAALPPVEPVEMFPSPVATAELVAYARRRLEALVAREVSGRLGRRVQCRVVIDDPFQAILEAARGMSAIVMGTLGRTGLAHLLLGSVAEKTVRHSPVPVLTIRPGRTVRRRRGTRHRRAA